MVQNFYIESYDTILFPSAVLFPVSSRTFFKRLIFKFKLTLRFDVLDDIKKYFCEILTIVSEIIYFFYIFLFFSLIAQFKS